MTDTEISILSSRLTNRPDLLIDPVVVRKMLDDLQRLRGGMRQVIETSKEPRGTMRDIQAYAAWALDIDIEEALA